MIRGWRSAEPAEADPLLGKVVGERYCVDAMLARGGQSGVYLATQRGVGRQVVLKILTAPREESLDPEFRRRFMREAETIARLSHPNTVTMFDYGASEGLTYIAMEHVQGRTLKQALRDDGAFAPERAIAITLQIGRALREAHGLGVVHRDMKPGNVMLVQRDGTEHVKVLDFGLAKDTVASKVLMEQLTQQGVFLGSPRYMAPEQAEARGVDARADIYSVGVMLFEMLTGNVPYAERSPVRTLLKHIRDPIPALVTPSGAPVPEPIAQVVRRCMAKSPDERYADTSELIEALESCARHQSAKEREEESRAPESTPIAGALPPPLTTPRDEPTRRVAAGIALALLGAAALLAASQLLDLG